MSPQRRRKLEELFEAVRAEADATARRRIIEAELQYLDESEDDITDGVWITHKQMAKQIDVNPSVTLRLIRSKRIPGRQASERVWECRLSDWEKWKSDNGHT